LEWRSINPNNKIVGGVNMDKKYCSFTLEEDDIYSFDNLVHRLNYLRKLSELLSDDLFFVREIISDENITYDEASKKSLKIKEKIKYLIINYEKRVNDHWDTKRKIDAFRLVGIDDEII